MERELVTIREFGSVEEALLAQGCLCSAGIDCHLVDLLHLGRQDWHAAAMRGVSLQVPREDAEDAVAILDEPPLDEAEAGED